MSQPKEIKIKLATINDVKEFVSQVSQYDAEMDIISGRHTIDAKSIMGLFSLDLSSPVTLKIYSDDATDIALDLSKFSAE